MMDMDKSIIPVERIEKAIFLLHGQKVMLDQDLASLYGVETKVLVQAVKRNIERFPSDFMFQLTQQEFKNLRSQNVTSSSWGGMCYPPIAFTALPSASRHRQLRGGVKEPDPKPCQKGSTNAEDNPVHIISPQLP